jgi:hypothetical protein
VKNRIFRICGEADIVPNFEEISNNSNYVFTADPAFETITLFDSSNNVVNLNSWTECAYYVNGGWTNNKTDFINGEQIIFFVSIFLISFYFLYEKYLKKINFKEFFQNFELKADE